MNIKNKLLGIALVFGLATTPQEVQATTPLEYLNTAAVASVAVVSAVYTVKFSKYGARKIKKIWNYFSNDTKQAALSSLVTLAVVGIANKTLKKNIPSGLDFLPNLSDYVEVEVEVKATKEGCPTKAITEKPCSTKTAK